MDGLMRPIGAFLLGIYNMVGNYGLAMIVLAVVVMLILLPFQMKAKPGQIKQARLSPKLAEIRKKHAGNNVKIQEETQKLWKEEGVSPFSGCLWNLIPLPIMIMLFQVIRRPLTLMLDFPRSFVESDAVSNLFERLDFPATMNVAWEEIEQAQFMHTHFEEFYAVAAAHYEAFLFRTLDFNFLGMNLGLQPQWNFLFTADWGNAEAFLPGFGLFLIPLVAGVAAFINARVNRKFQPGASPDGSGGQMQAMMLMMPVLSIVFGFMFPAALGLYWTAQSVIRVGQDVWLNRRYSKIVDAEDAVRLEERKKKEAELEAKRLETERKKAEGIAERNKNTSKRKLQSTERSEQQEKASQWQKKNTPESEADLVAVEPGRVDDRPYARGRAYKPERYERGGKSKKQTKAQTTDDYNDEYDGLSTDDSFGELTDLDIGSESTEHDVVNEIKDNDDFISEDDIDDIDDEHDINDELSSNTSGEPGEDGDEDATKRTVRFETARFEDKQGDE